ncbi:uncharacterized protein [Rutidosis leptorrhynchoides]|uniref:uncharacterized protein n=1 Tax=Rutidosis leptorrhynchoides TaxID=125765 RepID=UPI003A9A358A
MLHLYEAHEELHSFPKILSNIDCMHWELGNYPVSWRDIPFYVNGVEYKRGYYLAYEISPTWASFVKLYSSAADQKRCYFLKKQASAHKDVERTFGILQGRWNILQQPPRSYKVKAIQRIMYANIIMH